MGIGNGMLYDLQNGNVFSLRLKVLGVADFTNVEWESVRGFGGCNAEGSLAEFVGIAAGINPGLTPI